MRRAKRAGGAAVLLVATLIRFTTAVNATGPSLTDDPTSGPPGASFTVTGTGFCATTSQGCTAVTIEFNGTAIRRDVQVDAAGSFVVTLGAGGGTGSVLILATQNNDAIQARTYFTVTPGVSRPPGAATPAPTPGSTAVPSTAPAGPAAPPPTGTPSGAAGNPAGSAGSGGHGSGSGPSALVLALAAAAAAAAVVVAALGARRLLTRPATQRDSPSG